MLMLQNAFCPLQVRWVNELGSRGLIITKILNADLVMEWLEESYRLDIGAQEFAGGFRNPSSERGTGVGLIVVSEFAQ